MGGKKKTKWRKLPLGELTQGTTRGSNGTGSFRGEREDGLPENAFSNHHHYDTKSDECQWEEARNTGYYAQGPPHLYSSNTSSRGQGDMNQEETAEESDDRTGTFFNGFWIPDSDLDQFNTINNAFEPFLRQVPVFFCPPVMPYCSAPYPHFRTAYQSEAPFFPSFCIPSDSHYYHHFTRPGTASKEEDYPPESEVEITSPPVTDSDMADAQQAPQQQQQPNFEDGENQQEPLHPEVTTDTAVPYPYTGYTFGEPVYSVPIFPLLPPTPTSYPKQPWSATQTPRKRRRKRKEYNADYAVIPVTKNSSQGNKRTTDSKGDLGKTRDNTTGNNECCNQREGSDTHSVSVTGSSPSTKETNQNDCVLNNQESDDAESAYLSQREITIHDATNIVESTREEEFSKKGHCEIIEESALISEILSELIQKVVNESPQVLGKGNKCTSNCQSTQHLTGNFSHVIEPLGNSDDNSAHFDMENILRKSLNANLPEVHKKLPSDLVCIENDDSHTSSKNYCNNETSADNFVHNENRKNLSLGKPVKLSINEENNFFEISLVHEGDAVPITEEELFTGTGGDLQASVNINDVEHGDNLTENKQPKVQEDDLRHLEQNNLHSHSATTEEQSDCSVETHKVRTQNQSDLGNASEYLNNRTDTAEVRNPCIEDYEAKNCEDSLDSLTSNESCRDKQLSDSHRSSPHSFLSYVANSEALIRETELELSKIQHLTSRPPLQANQSIYKFAFDENLSDQSDTEDKETPIPFPELPHSSGKDADAEDFAAVSAQMRQDIQRSEIVVHEGDSASEAGSEDVELLPHRYESQGGDKHLYVNKLSLAVELLRTHEKLPYDDEFKRVVDDEGENVQPGKGNVVSAKPRSVKAVDVSSGTVNPAFVDDSSSKFRISPPLNDVSIRPGFQKSPAPVRSLQDIEQHRHSRISTADSGVQSEDSGDEMCEEAKEVYGRLGFTESEEQELWNPASDATMAYRRFGAQAPHRFNIFTPRAGGLNPCFCCNIM